MEIKKELFYHFDESKEINSYEMINDNGMSVKTYELGAGVLEIKVKDKNDKLIDVTLGFDKNEDYFRNWQGFGAVIGRCANRIDKASFVLNGKKYKLVDNMRGFTLHSGKGFNFHIWESGSFIDDEGCHTTYKLFSEDGDQGFPGNLHVKVEYLLDNQNRLNIKYSGLSDSDTILNLTNHTYFNLDGCDAGEIWNHEVWIDSDSVTKVDERLMPTGEIVDVAGTPFDFREMKKIGSYRGQSFSAVCPYDEYDINYFLNTEFGNVKNIARLRAEKSGIVLNVYTDMPGVQLYTANALGDKRVKGKNRSELGKNYGVCFETQFAPNAINIPHFKQPVIKKDEEFNSTTIFEFQAE